MDPNFASTRFQGPQKRLIRSQVDVNQLIPLKYAWAWEHFINGCSNNWMPHEVPMNEDIVLWKSNELSTEEKHLLLRTFGFFSTAESLVSNNLTLAIYKHVTNAEARQYLLRQAFEEAVHTHTFLYICESLSLDPGVVWNMYHEVPSIAEKDEFEILLTQELTQEGFSTESFEGAQKFLENLIGFYVILEGIFFYGGFAMVLAFQRQNKMRGTCQLYEFILRDETIHLNFGIDLINGIKEENKELWTLPFQNHIIDIIKHAVELEQKYIHETLPRDIFGLSAKQLSTYIEYLADRRLERIGLKIAYGVDNPLPWMSEAIDLYKEKNFFENIVTEYRSSANLKWDNGK